MSTEICLFFYFDAILLQNLSSMQLEQSTNSEWRKKPWDQ